MNNTIDLISKTFCIITVVLVMITISSATTTNQDLNLKAKQNLTQELNDNQQLQNERKTISTSSRSGRMLDLDHLAGDIGKEEKLAKERMLSGQRQSRILSEDIVSNGKQQQMTTINDGTLERSRKANNNKNKKMAIKGFIPIISLEGGKEGKHFENAMDAINGNSSEDDDDDDNNRNGEQENASNEQTSKEQVLSGYGGQTSMGHATFGLQPSTASNNEQWQQYNNNYDQSQELARHKKLLGGTNGLLGSLSTPGKRFVSSLVPSASTAFGQHQLQAPMNIPMIKQQSPDPSSGECMCVPFYQCKGGYLTEAQLTKSNPLTHLFANQQRPHNIYQQQAQFALGHQVPRSINLNDIQQQQQHLSKDPTKDLSYANQQQISNMLPQISQSNMNLEQQQQQQNVNDLIYEQLRKSIDSNNLEQQLLQQQPPYVSIDERSKSGNQQQINNSTTNNDEVFERSLLNPLGRRQSTTNQNKSCGIMRICCKIPPTLTNNNNNNPNRLGYQLQQAHNPRLINNRPTYQPQYQLLQPTSLAQQHHQSIPNSNSMTALNGNNNNFMDQFINNQQDYLSSTSLQIPTTNLQQQYNKPAGSFMAGRCGIRSTMGISGRVQNAQPMPGSESTAEFGEFPAHVAILRRLSPGDSMFVCSAVLISNQWIATAAHCVRKHRAEELKVRLGEWDVNRDDEFYPFVESSIRDIVLHPDFQPSSLINDLALLRLEQPVDGAQMPHISPACLPAPDEQFNQQRCWVAGWGKDAFGQHGTFQSVLKKVDLPVVRREDCENALRFETKLGKFFRLHSSAICAGGERGKDACEGDGGAGLYCIEPESGLTKVVGLVSWGVGCGQKGVPGVYTNLAQLSPWIEQFVASSGEENLYMDRNSNQGTDNSFKNVISERSNNQLSTATNTTNLPNIQQTNTVTNNSTSSSSSDNSEELESRAG